MTTATAHPSTETSATIAADLPVFDTPQAWYGPDMARRDDWIHAFTPAEIDVLIDPGAATRALLEDFERLAPFGPGNPEPSFALVGVQAREPVQMNGGHVRCRLVGADGASVRAIAWRCADLPLGRALLAGQGGLSVVGRLKADDWNGRRGVQFEIEDVADPRMTV